MLKGYDKCFNETKGHWEQRLEKGTGSKGKRSLGATFPLS